MTQLTTDRSPEWLPRVSPDEQRIAFYAERNGNRDIWVMPADGGRAIQITRDPAFDMAPSWSPDSRELAFHSGKSKITNVFVVSAAGGDPRQVTNFETGTFRPAWFPDGTSIAVIFNRRIWRVAIGDGTVRPLSASQVEHSFRLSKDGKRIYFPRSGNLWELTWADGRERPLTRLSGRPGALEAIDLAVGSTHLYFMWSSDVGDIWVMDVARNE